MTVIFAPKGYEFCSRCGKLVDNRKTRCCGGPGLSCQNYKNVELRQSNLEEYA